ncbi:MAG: RagB/SusD family nutrient uptake outer membrane protein [Bacteroidota bacterium]|jgi:hypothetical protein|nr:RagB/SusD family nutrient uptake outer membrane protein [Bacteroidota bacterium]HHU95960.1 RagB/SusD family nutrient uptake outer membrane protein [Petrimonas sp.]
MKYLFVFLSIILVFSSCEEYLDKIEEADGMSKEEVFGNYQNYRKFADKMYQDRHNYLSQGDYTPIACMADEGTAVSGWPSLAEAQNGNWIGLMASDYPNSGLLGGVWRSWRSIRIANMTLANLHMLDNDPTVTKQQIDQLKGQAHFMRAWYYYEYLRRQGGMPYIEYAFDADDNFALPRLSRQETAEKIAADCDTAFQLLPERWPEDHIGRPEKGSALALKAAALLIPASKQYNTGNESSRWEAVAEAAWNAIDFAKTTRRYSLLTSNSTSEVTYKTPGGVKTISYASGFDSIFMYMPYNDEIMWEHYSAINENMYNIYGVPSIVSAGIVKGYSVSANIVDRFETLNGLAIQDDISYDPQNPYVNRDPRFYHSILFNQQRWTSESGRYLELWNGGSERLAENFYNRSGYLARKFWAPNRDQFSGRVNENNHAIYFRLAEMYLIYAEAANELGGPDHKASGADMSAVDAVNVVRARVKMPPVNSIYLTKDAFRLRIQNERAVEFFLEGKRLFDLMRWGLAHQPEYKNLYAVDLVKDDSKPTGFAISRSDLPFHTNVFEPKQYNWPVPMSDGFMFDEFKQNPGW